MNYSYVESNRHFVVSINNKKYVIDTGAPNSFRFGNNFSVKIDDKVYHLTEYEYSKKKIYELVGMQIDGIIGLDILEKTGIYIDRKNSTIEFSYLIDDTFKNNLYLDKYIAYYFSKDFCFNGLKLNLIVDTGAVISYIDLNKVEGEKLDEVYNDYSPILGTLKGNFYSFKLETENSIVELKAGALPEKLKAISDGVIGINDLFKEKMLINFKDLIIRFD